MLVHAISDEAKAFYLGLVFLNHRSSR
jgi:hypothetical protein